MMIIENHKTKVKTEPVLPEISEKVSDLKDKKARALEGGGLKRIQAQHAKGKLTARERINVLLDPGTFEEIGTLALHNCNDSSLKEQQLYGDSVVTGYGNINGKKIFVYAQDFTVLGGTLSLVAGQKICRVMDMAASCGCPVIGLLDSGGARIQEGISSLIGCGEIFTRNTMYSGVIPQISVVMGPCAGAAVYSPALTDFIFMVNDSGQMYVTGPTVVKAVTGEDNSAEDTGGASVHSTKSGNCHFVYNTEEECLSQVRRLLGFLPPNNRQKPKYWDMNTEEMPDEEILSLVPSEPNKPYDMTKIIMRLVDDGDFMEVHERFARNIIVGFGKIGGRNVGIIAQQPQVLAGSLTVDASDKAARFIRFCDCFNIPLITLVDVPGYMPGVEQEHHGIIRHGAKILFAYAEATTPKISIVVRKAYGGAYIAMSSKSLRGDINYAWPTAEFAVMGPEGAVNIIYRDIIAKSVDPEATTQSLIDEYRTKFANPYTAAANNYIDDVIDPRESRLKIIKALVMLDSKADSLPAKKHGNMPL